MNDITKDQAIEEVQKFLGEGWIATACGPDDDDDPNTRCYVRAFIGHVTVAEFAPTFRAAVDQLKTTWRTAVEPWMENAIDAKLDTADVDGYAPTERVIDRMFGVKS